MTNTDPVFDLNTWIALLANRELLSDSFPGKQIKDLEKRCQAVLELRIAEQVLLKLLELQGVEPTSTYTVGDVDIVKRAWRIAKLMTNEGYGWK